MLQTILKSLPQNDPQAANVGTPQLIAWCCWGKVVQSEDEPSSGGAAGEAIGLMAGGHVGANVGRLIVSALELASRGEGDIIESGRSYIASFGRLALTPTEVVLVDCGCRGRVLDAGITERQIEDILQAAVAKQLKPTVWRAPRENVQAILRDGGVILQLRGIGPEVWKLQLARAIHDAGAFVRDIMNVGELPTVDAFIQASQTAPPDAALLDRMVADGRYVDRVLKCLGSLKRDALDQWLGNVADTESGSFAVQVEAWLAQHGRQQNPFQLGWLITGAAALVCIWYLIFPAPYHSTDAFRTEELRTMESIGAAILLIACAVLFFLASKAKWFTARLEIFRTARIRRAAGRRAVGAS